MKRHFGYDENKGIRPKRAINQDNDYLKRFTLPKPTINEAPGLRNYDIENQNRTEQVEETKAANPFTEKEHIAAAPTASCIKRMSEHPRARLRKIWSKGNE